MNAINDEKGIATCHILGCLALYFKITCKPMTNSKFGHIVQIFI